MGSSDWQGKTAEQSDCRLIGKYQSLGCSSDISVYKNEKLGFHDDTTKSIILALERQDFVTVLKMIAQTSRNFPIALYSWGPEMGDRFSGHNMRNWGRDKSGYDFMTSTRHPKVSFLLTNWLDTHLSALYPFDTETAIPYPVSRASQTSWTAQLLSYYLDVLTTVLSFHVSLTVTRGLNTNFSKPVLSMNSCRVWITMLSRRWWKPPFHTSWPEN